MKNKFKLIPVMIIAMLILSMTSYAEKNLDNGVYTNNMDVQVVLSDIMFKNLEIASDISNEDVNADKYAELKDSVEELRAYVFDLYFKSNQIELNNFFAELEWIDPYTRSVIEQEIIIPLSELKLVDNSERSEVIYIPGYGYTDPNYLYRLGRELKSVHVQNFWKEEKRTLEENKKYKYYVEMSMATQISQEGGAGGNLQGFKITGKAMFNVNGQLKEFAQVEFEVKTKVETKAMLMYEKKKVTFELFKAKDSFWTWLGNAMEFKWEYAGTCFLYKEFPAVTDAIYAPELLMNL
ncbi:MAG: hypothetical protein M0R46_09295 [Candidatus Muirbacterium halophilum]|nr:hypothetical protein [Candidatus Muirbacterium halophilum]MCK9476102.1 hypothetical protein [Candidatus Muirbacterium halophilum]